MEFEYDSDKSATNHDKHGIDFEEAKLLWDDELRLVIDVANDGEKRYIVIGTIKDKHWTAVITERSSNIRIISVRRSRKKEIKTYDDQKNDNG